MSERILCAAVWVDDGVARVHQPTKTGIVFCGHRHPACLEQAAGYFRDEHPPYGHRWDELRREGKTHQGFLTSQNRYVDREEAFQIALVAGQLAPRLHPKAGTDKNPELFSEDLY